MAPRDSEGCKARVPDNGDTYQCDSKVKLAGLCAEHLPKVRLETEEQLVEGIQNVLQLWRKYQELHSTPLPFTIFLVLLMKAEAEHGSQ